MIWLLNPYRKKNDQQAFVVLLDALAPVPLEDTEALEKAIDRSRKRKDLTLTEEQGHKLAALGVQLKGNWFKPKVAKVLEAVGRLFK